jgi:hypothetical protein
MKLYELLQSNPKLFNTDKHGYIEYYDSIFESFKHLESFSLLEIGILNGGSLNLWKQYFKGQIIGIDIFARTSYDVVKSNILDDIELYKVDSFNDSNLYGFDAIDSRNQFYTLFTDKSFNVIIDDGHHDGLSQRKTYENFKQFMAPNSIYIIEDIDPILPNYKYLTDIPNIEFVNLRRHVNDNLGILGVIKF